MKKIFSLATALILMAGVSKAAKNDIDVKAATTVSADNKASIPVVATATTSVSMADLIKENQQLKLALQKANAEKEALAGQIDYQHNMHFTTVSLYEAQLQKKEEDAKDQSGFAWMMHNVILKLNNVVNAAK